MKGFVYLLEISIALILILTILGTLSSFKSKENWERPDLISAGDNIMRLIENEDVLEILKGNFSKIENSKPPNIDFGIKISGISKSNISVGCVQNCDYVKNLTTNLSFNNRWVNFSVEQFSIGAAGIPSKYDVVVFVNYTDYTNQKTNITNYLNKGGVVIGVNGTYSNNDDFNDIFGLSIASSGSGDFNFTAYNPSEDETEKYFAYMGFDVNTNNAIDPSTRQGDWYIWETPRKVNITSSYTVDIENKSASETGLNGLNLNDNFSIKMRPADTNFYTFKISKISWSDNLTVFQPLDMPFTFKDFSEANDVNGKYNILALPDGQAEMSSNNTAIWISDFPWSDEYRILVRNAIASRVKEWYVKNPDFTKEYATVSTFFPLCCDMPETAEMTIYLWYKI